jgi:5'-AMP-activated protein kinase catalytic alpha subunit
MIPKLLGEFKIGKTIGEGAFSKVKIATHISGTKVAIKIIDKEKMKHTQKEKATAKAKRRSAAKSKEATSTEGPKFLSELEVFWLTQIE